MLNDLCNEPCHNERVLTCGGKNHYAVYHVTNFKNDDVKVTMPTLAIYDTPLTLGLNARNKTVFRLYKKDWAFSTSLSSYDIKFRDLGVQVSIKFRRTNSYPAKKTFGLTLPL